MTAWEKETKRDYGVEHLRVRLKAGHVIIESQRTAADRSWTTVVVAAFSPAEWTDLVADVAAAHEENEEMEAQDVERIFRDVLSTQGLHDSLLNVERTPDGWRVTLRDAADRMLSTDLADGPPAAIRAALTQWSERQL
jgi:hypothetical protein